MPDTDTCLDAVTPLPGLRAGVICQPVPEGAVLLATREEVYYGLNEAGAAIWSLLTEAPGSLEALVARLHERYPEVAPEVLRQDVVELLDDLAAAGLVGDASTLA